MTRGAAFGPPFLFGSGDEVVRAFSFQKVPKCDWHGPRSHIDHVLPIKTADQVPAQVVQIGIDDDGNPRPLFVVTKNLTVANYGDILAGLGIDNIAVEHFFGLRVRCDAYNSAFGALFRLPCYFVLYGGPFPETIRTDGHRGRGEISSWVAA
jgi:hypothetical protein